MTVIEATLTLHNETGLHLRPATEFVKVAARFASRITVSYDGQEVDGKSIMGVVMLAAETGAEIRIRADGSDEHDALEALRHLVEGRFGEG